MKTQRSVSALKTERSIKNIRILDKSPKPEPVNTASTSRRESGKSICSTNDDNIQTQRQGRSSSNWRTTKENHSPIIIRNMQQTSIEKQNLRQKQEEKYIKTMLGKLKKKQEKQLEKLREFGWVGEELVKAEQENKKLRGELMELKELMKGLLLEREELRMLTFYQDD